MTWCFSYRKTGKFEDWKIEPVASFIESCHFFKLTLPKRGISPIFVPAFEGVDS